MFPVRTWVRESVRDGYTRGETRVMGYSIRVTGKDIGVFLKSSTSSTIKMMR